MNAKRDSKFYDLSEIIFTDKSGFMNKSDIKKLYNDSNLLTKYILENEINYGDIIFIGGNSDRQEYCFKIVINDGKYIGGDCGNYILFNSRHENFLQKIKELNISYEKVLNELYNDDTFNELFFNDLSEYEECINMYIEHNLI